MQANDPYSSPNWLVPSVSDGLPQLSSSPYPKRGPVVPFPFRPHMGPATLNQPQMQPISQRNMAPTVVGQKRRRIDVSFGFQSTFEVEEEKQLRYESMARWKEEKKRLNQRMEELKVRKWISEQKCKRLETECRQLKADVAKLTQLEMVQIDQIQQTEEDPVIEELRNDKEHLEEQVAQLQTTNKVGNEAQMQLQSYCKQLQQRLNQWERKQQSTQTDHSMADHMECEKKQTEMKEQIRIIKEENEAQKNISEKRENNLKMRINQAEKRIKTLKEAKKKLQTQGISSQLGFKKKVEELEEKLKAANSHQQLQAMSYDSLEFQLKTLESELAKTKESLSSVIEEKQRAVNEVKQLKANAERRSREYHDLETHVNDLESELAITKESMVAVTEQKEKAVREGLRLMAEHSAKIKHLEADAKERVSNEFAAKYQALELQHRLTEGEMNKAYNQLSALEDTNETLTKRCEDLEHKLKEGSEQHQSLLTQHQETFSKLSQLQNEHRELKRNLHKTVSQLDKETAEKNNFAMKLKLVETRLSESLTEKSNEQKVSEEQLKKSSKLEKMLEEKSIELCMANAEKDNLKMKLTGLENDLDGLKKEMDELAALVEESKMNMKGKETKDLQKRLSLLEKENNRLKIKIQKITQEESSQTDPSDLESEFQQLQKSLIDTQTQFCQHLSAKDEQIVAVNSQLAKTQQQLDRINQR